MFTQIQDIDSIYAYEGEHPWVELAILCNALACIRVHARTRKQSGIRKLELAQRDLVVGQDHR